MSSLDLLLFGNVSQPPFCNNLFPPVRAFQRAFRTRVVEPQRYAGFEPTGGARPALVPDAAVDEHTDPMPDVIVCLGGALHFSERSLRELRNRRVLLAGFALSDPYGLRASLAIAREFDLFYTQDPQTLPDYAGIGVAAARCDPATDAELYHPERSRLTRDPDCDVLYYGKWTEYRNIIVGELARRVRVRVHAYAGETRWSVPAAPPCDTPDALRAALNGARLALETARLDDAEGKYRGAFRITPRPFFAASCGVPSLVETFPGLSEFFAPGEEIATYESPEAAGETAARLCRDEPARVAMGRRARSRALRDHTWDRRIEAFVLDVEKRRRAARGSTY
ncbi:MAG TPA: glycosyltransferase [Thermoanaerobaculia bacterium]|jgi:spore maturation protein CgeB|nr:glycosyltransferase [Thermoanaerobaculia bacterium]